MLHSRQYNGCPASVKRYFIILEKRLLFIGDTLNKRKCNPLANEWGHTTYWSQDAEVSRGVGILINKTASINVLDSFSDACGRVIGLQYEENKCLRSKRRIFFFCLS